MNFSTKDAQSQVLLLAGIFILIFGVRLHLIELLAYITPYYDDWRAGAFMRLYKIGELSIDRLFDPFNGHLALWSNLSNFLFFDLNQQQWDPRFHMVFNALVWASTGTLLVRIGLNQTQQINAAVFIPLILILWLFPFSLLNALWGVQTHNYLMILLSVSSIWLITARAWTPQWLTGVALGLAAPLTMGGGAFVSISIFAFTLFKIVVNPKDLTIALPTLKVSFFMTLLSLGMLYFLSGGHEVYYAKSVSDFITTLAKTLSFPLSTKVLPALVLLSPVLILTIRAVQKAGLNERLTSFTLTMFVFVLAIAVAIGYARGADGKAPSPRYFEFLELYVIVSALALLIIQRPAYAIKPAFNSVLVIGWLIIIMLGGEKHINRLSDTISHRSIVKPAEEDVVRRYLNNRDIEVFKRIPINKLPFAGPYGLQHFIENIEPLNMLPYELQVQPEMRDSQDGRGFIKNGSIRVTKKEFGTQYRHENIIGSYVPKNGGMKSTGVFTSQIMDKTDRPFLMIPVMGYLGYKGLTLKVVDEQTGEERSVVPDKLDSSYAEVWREIFIKAPKNSYRLIATDSRADLWFGFAAPRTVGRLTLMTLAIVEQGKHIWKLGLLLILIGLRTTMIRSIRLKTTSVT